MAATWNSSAVMAVCRKFTGAAPAKVTVPEPYLPYVPDPWNGILVLAEAQQLASANEYREWLLGLSSDERIRRLYLRSPDNIGVGPWDDGSIKLGLLAMLPELRLTEVAVSNAVPWSWAKGRSNQNPTEEMQKIAAAFWRELLTAWRPEIRCVVAVGKPAQSVMTASEVKTQIVPLASSSRNFMGRVRWLFDPDDLLRHYPDVQRATEAVGIRLEGDKEFHNKVFFACHAVSVGRQKLANALKRL